MQGGFFLILAVDVGNSNIVIGAYQNEILRFVARISSRRDITKDELAVQLKGVLTIYNVVLSDIEGAIISSVVPQITMVLSNAIEWLTGRLPLIVGPGIKTGINILIDNPAQLGSDLLVASVAAIAKYPKPIIIFDMGTATKIIVINQQGSLLGGAIFPGVRIALDALCDSAALLQQVSIDAPKKVIGKNTQDSMKSGIVFGNASMIDGMIERSEDELGMKCTIIGTGGLAEEICRHTKHEVIYNRDLLLDGLYLLYKKNVINA